MRIGEIERLVVACGALALLLATPARGEDLVSASYRLRGMRVGAAGPGWLTSTAMSPTISSAGVSVGQPEAIGPGFVAEKRDGRSGGWIPESLVAVTAPFMDLRFHPEAKTTLGAIRVAFSVPLDRSMRQFVGFENTTVQTPISYLPQSLGMNLGKALDLGPLALLYLGRGANLIASLLVVLLAIRAAPDFKWVFVLVALMRMAVFPMASVAADALTNAVSLLFTALILRSLSPNPRSTPEPWRRCSRAAAAPGSPRSWSSLPRSAASMSRVGTTGNRVGESAERHFRFL